MAVVGRPIKQQLADAEIIAAYVETGGNITAVARQSGLHHQRVTAAVTSPSGVRLLAEALTKHEQIVENALVALSNGLNATQTAWSKDGTARTAPDYRARVMAAGKILDVAMKVDDLAHRVASYEATKRDAPTGRLLTPEELAAMTPYDRMQAVLLRQRVMTVEVVDQATLILEAGEPEPAIQAAEAANADRN